MILKGVSFCQIGLKMLGISMVWPIDFAVPTLLLWSSMEHVITRTQPVLGCFVPGSAIFEGLLEILMLSFQS